ncbi:MAG: hypothetical protein PUI31_01480 [Clostridia bacterium]|nr:hypothetical protein [Clostridia bacterium]
MKTGKIRKLTLSLLFAVVAAFCGIFALSSAVGASRANAEGLECTTEEKSFYLRGSIEDGNVRLTISMASYDCNLEGKFDFNGSMYGFRERLAAINFYDYVKVNDKTLTEIGATIGYGAINFVNCPYNLLLDFSYTADPIESVTKVELLQGAQIPSAAFVKNESNLVYVAGCKYVGTSGHTYGYGWQTIGYTNVSSVVYAQGHDGDYGYVGFNLSGNDYGTGVMTEIPATVKDNSGYGDATLVNANYASAILANDEQGKYISAAYFNLGEKGQGCINVACNVAQENLASVTIPAGTVFPSRLTQDRDKIDGSAWAFVYYQTTESVTFVPDGQGGYVVKTGDYKDDAVSEIVSYKSDVAYRPYDQAIKDRIVAKAVADINAAESEDAVSAIVSEAKTAIDAVKTRDQRAAEDATFAFTTVDSAFFLQSYLNGDKLRITVSVPNYDYTGDGFDFNDGLDGLTTRLTRLNMLTTYKVNGKTLSEMGASLKYVAINWAEPNTAIIMDFAYDGSVTAVESVELLKGAQVPSKAFFYGEDNPVVYQACSDYKAVSAAADYGWITTAETEIQSLEYFNDGTTANGYFAFALTGGDFDCETKTINETNSLFTVGSNLYVNGNSEVKPVTANAYYQNGKVYVETVYNYGRCTSVTIPTGTRFAALSSTLLKGINGGNVPQIVYETKSDVTFVATENNAYISMAEYKAAKKAELSAYRTGKTDSDYFSAQVEELNGAIATAETAIGGASTTEAIDRAVADCKAALDAVKTKQAFITAAQAELDGYKSEENYFRPEEAAQRSSIVQEAKADVAAAESAEAVNAIVAEAKTAIDALKTNAQYADEEFAALKDTARANINALYVPEKYLSEQAEVIAGIISQGIAAVDGAVDEQAIQAAVTAAQEEASKVQTKEQIVSAAKAEIAAYKADVIYLTAETAQRQSAIDAANAKIDAAASQEVVNNSVAEAQTAIDGLKTKAEYDAEALVAKKEAAKAEINGISGGIDVEAYTEEDQNKIAALLSDARKAVENATSEEAVDQAVATLRTELERIQPSPERDSSTSSGCLSTFGTGSAVFFLLFLLIAAGRCVMIFRKEN